MYYFDSEFLQQYLDQNIKPKIFDGKWYQIANISDVSDSEYGVAYDTNGQVHRFDYRDIQQIKAGKNLITLDTLQTMKGQEPQKEPEKPKETSEEEPPEKEADLSWYSPVYDIGRKLIKDARKNGK